MARGIGAALVAAVLGFAGGAWAADDTCVTTCQAKMNACARQCSQKSGHDLEACQLGCSKVLFTRCFQLCAESGVVIKDDYEIVVPGEEAEAEP